ncbi:MAG: histidine phosphatase family protein [Proteobacteria bacterium]|nr:histidine phosphatase family protein [Desulfobacula sp.]MBU3950590.1 histidine phosphatase family protein [Pseudomonadota bacterium]MBU4132333.1 histidine phosphatase family protein [Pseudomonadota bacterium]
MKLKHEVRSRQTIDTITALLENGIQKISVIIRHSDRFYPKEARMEPFMGLTDEGKNFALELGRALPEQPAPKLFSSTFGRCIETAYLIDKGYTQQHKTPVSHNTTSEHLAPFYIKDIEKAIHMVEAQGSQCFIRNWFDNNIDDTIMESPEKTSAILSQYMTDRLKQLNGNEIAVCVSHDWNIFPLKEFKLKLPHETKGDVGYLDGVIFYEDCGRYFVTSFQSDPQPV